MIKINSWIVQISRWALKINLSTVATNHLTVESSQSTAASTDSAAESPLPYARASVFPVRSVYQGSTPLKYPFSNRNLPLGW